MGLAFLLLQGSIPLEDATLASSRNAPTKGDGCPREQTGASRWAAGGPAGRKLQAGSAGLAPAGLSAAQFMDRDFLQGNVTPAA